MPFTKQQLTALPATRQQADPLADAWLAQTMASPASTTALRAALGNPAALWAIASEEAPQLIESLQQSPPWAKRYWQTEAAQIYASRSAEILLLLGLYSLPYCYAAADGAAVLAATERLSSKAQAFKRLQETATFVHTILTGGTKLSVWQACLQVRTIHALTRWHLLAKGWPATQMGVPINQEDQAGTLLAFGYVTAVGMQRLGRPLSPAQEEAYLGWFAVVGHALGVDSAWLCPTRAQASALAKAIESRQHKASPHGPQLTQALLQSFSDTQMPPWLKDNPGLYVATLVGQRVAELLGLPQPDTKALAQLQRFTLVLQLAQPFGIGQGIALQAMGNPLAASHS